METSILTAIIAASSALLGATIGGLFSMRTATRAHRRQLEIQQIQFKAQMEMKARELMFGVYQKKIDDELQGIKLFGSVMGKLAMAIRVTDIDEQEKLNVLAEYIGVLRPLAEQITESYDEIETELKIWGLWSKWSEQFLFVKSHLTSKISQITPEEIESSYETATKALSYIAQIQTAISERKRENLFNEYLPASSKELN